ncbi:hypothetical protein BASA81_005317 [Batrachochytrium salamandrivorans]|nr:hypothetical protein BASA81_005317 [Batrachochytrium salamandrivorans]
MSNSKRPPPGFSAKPNAELDEASLSSMFRMALDDSSQDMFFAQQQQFQQDFQAPAQQQQQQRGFYPPQAFGQQQPPPPAFFQAPAPFVFQPPPQQQQQQQPTDQQQQPGRFPDFKYMKGREIAQIVRNQLRQVETGDEYADDYYFLHFQQRDAGSTAAADNEARGEDNEESVMSMLKSLHESAKPAHPLPAMAKKPLAVPTPNQPDGEKSTTQNALQLQLKWLDKTNALGRTAKSNIRTPKELIQVDADASGLGSGAFNSRGWELRQISLDVANALGQVKDLAQLLEAKQRAVHHPGQEWDPVRQVVSDLQQEQHAACVALAKHMGLVANNNNGDETLVNLLWLPKGRRLLLQAAMVLLPEHQILLMRAASRLMVYFACTTPTAQAKKSREGLELDLKVARVLKDLISKQQSLQEVKQCFQLLLKSNTPESLGFIVSSPGGAEVVKTMLFHGQALADNGGGDAEWSALFQEFIDMAERGIGN